MPDGAGGTAMGTPVRETVLVVEGNEFARHRLKASLRDLWHNTARSISAMTRLARRRWVSTIVIGTMATAGAAYAIGEDGVDSDLREPAQQQRARGQTLSVTPTAAVQISQPWDDSVVVNVDFDDGLREATVNPLEHIVVPKGWSLKFIVTRLDPGEGEMVVGLAGFQGLSSHSRLPKDGSSVTLEGQHCDEVPMVPEFTLEPLGDAPDRTVSVSIQPVLSIAACN